MVRRVRDEHELRLEDGERERRLGHGNSAVSRRSPTSLPARPTTTASSRPTPPARAAEPTGSSRPRSAPAVTGAATSVTPTSATLNGSVDPTAAPRPGTSSTGRARATARGRRSRTRAPAAARSPSPRRSRVSPAAASTTTGWSLRATPGRAGAPTRPSRPTGRRCDDRRGDVGDADVGAAERHDHPERAVDELVLRVRDEHGLRHADTIRGAGSGTRRTRVNVALTRLRAGVTYHYRLVATNASGTTVGRDRISARPASPSSAPTRRARRTATTATLTGSVDPRTGRRAGGSSTARRRATGPGRRRRKRARIGRTERDARCRACGRARPTTTGWSRRATRGRAAAPTSFNRRRHAHRARSGRLRPRASCSRGSCRRGARARP